MSTKLIQMRAINCAVCLKPGKVIGGHLHKADGEVVFAMLCPAHINLKAKGCQAFKDGGCWGEWKPEHGMVDATGTSMMGKIGRN